MTEATLYERLLPRSSDNSERPGLALRDHLSLQCTER